MVLVTNVQYNTCDGCGLADNPAEREYHNRVLDGEQGNEIGHLCDPCTERAMPLLPKSAEEVADGNM